MADDKKKNEKTAKGDKGADKPEGAAAAPKADKPVSDKAKSKRKEKAAPAIVAASGKAKAKGDKPARLESSYKETVIPVQVLPILL